MTPSCFWEKLWETLLLLKTKGAWVGLLDLRLKITSRAWLLGSGLKLIFHWKAHSLTFFKSSFNSFAEVFTSWTTENNDVLSEKSFSLEFKLSDKSFILEDSRNYVPPILVPSSAKRIATQIVVIAKLNERKDFIFRGFVCDIIRRSKELPVQS